MTVSDHDVLRIAAAPLGADEAYDLALDLGARLRVAQALQNALEAALQGPGRQQRRRNAGARRGVRILIDGDINAARSRLVDQPQRFDAAAPVVPPDDLVMRHLGRQAAALADRDDFLHAFDHMRRLVADMRIVMAAEAAGDLGELDQLIERSKRAGHVEQAELRPNAPSFMLCSTSAAHLFELIGRRRPIDLAGRRPRGPIPARQRSPC